MENEGKSKTVRIVEEKPPEAKKKKLTKEEKKALRQERLELKRKAAEEAKKQSFRDHLSRELTLAQSSRSILDQYWETILSEIKHSELTQRLKCMKQNLQFIWDKKGAMIERYLRLCDEADDQYRRRLQKHEEILDYLFKIHVAFQRSLQSLYESDCSIILSQFFEENQRRQDYLGDAENFFANFEVANDVLHTEELRQMAARAQFEKEDILFENAHKKDRIRDKVERNMVKLHQQMTAIVKEMQTDWTPERLEGYQKVERKVAKVDDEVDRMMRDAVSREREIRKLKRQLVEIKEAQCSQLDELKETRVAVQKRYWTARTFYKEFEAIDHQQLKDLAENSSNAIKAIAKVLKRAKVLLTLSKICQKHESDEDALLSYLNRIQLDVSHNEAEISAETSNLGTFWVKMSKVTLQRNVLKVQKETLERENQELQQQIKDHAFKSQVSANISWLGYGKQISVATCPAQSVAEIPQVRQMLKKFHKHSKSAD